LFRLTDNNVDVKMPLSGKADNPVKKGKLKQHRIPQTGDNGRCRGNVICKMPEAA
jgi:hypothetical protein